MTRNPFHLVEYSPWPLTGSMSAFFLTIGLSSWFHNYGHSLMVIGVILMTLTMYQWWRDITRESTLQGFHTLKVYNGLRWGMLLFITSEICFFFAFFWAYFHSSLAPNTDIGACWPPTHIYPLNPFQVPLLNTAILLASGVSVTWAHHSLMTNNSSSSIQSMLITILLGMYFSILQGLEYMETSFSISDSIYGSTFFVATGFHGLHVIIGSLFLLMSLIRILMSHFSPSHHFGFEAAAWYWHFVDVVWLFLYTFIYWWGS
uniref:Cytochrome c oxidase subunit 3 n=1 Tax=Tremoctopus violaceus TaxID=102883 RepID=A0A3Q8CQU9_9MOLL|nr:cytochrome c oxidase subunit III [Tremoctopus violaceus]ATR85792.1 cytochrome c oxidase subunit III [Tremoctopus violaceus]WBK26786.1 cytochrome c oxidase subunit III [Tremoctopus violaceus]